MLVEENPRTTSTSFRVFRVWGVNYVVEGERAKGSYHHIAFPSICSNIIKSPKPRPQSDLKFSLQKTLRNVMQELFRVYIGDLNAKP